MLIMLKIRPSQSPQALPKFAQKQGDTLKIPQVIYPKRRWFGIYYCMLDGGLELVFHILGIILLTNSIIFQDTNQHVYPVDISELQFLRLITGSPLFADPVQLGFRRIESRVQFLVAKVEFHTFQ